MSGEGAPLDRAIILASLRDYVEQIRAEGLEGLPTSAAVQSRSPEPRASRSARISATAPLPIPAAPAPTSADTSNALFEKYPGLAKTNDLAALREFIGDCDRCKLAPLRTNLVFGVGDPNAQLMFIGEAPGADEDARGGPFVGRAGQLLTDIIERGMGLSRVQVYICNVIKCRPPENRNPEPDEVASCEPFLFRQIELVQPKVIVALGAFAVQALLKVKTPISKLRGNWHEVRGVRMMPTFHPAYLLRNPADKRLVWSDIQLVMKELGMALPNQRSRP
ncbi:MAG TPA: uracil-DNA glycosylase [Candidatus Binataceae bacterium]|nr:uracil-DNA glycosylase [Candidatus Binataceae bacterium]